MSNTAFTRRQALFATAGLAAAAAMTAAPAHAEFQPMMEGALNSLKMAKAQLVNATADKGGHRLAALNFIDKAINHVELGISWDDMH